MSGEREFTFKIIILGPAAVGKSSLIRRYVENRFSTDYKFTIGVDFMTKSIEYEPKKIAKLSIWDIGGQQRFKFLRRSFYEGTNGALLVFDLSRASTFPRLKEWLSDMRSTIQKEIPLVLIGNKSDLIPDVGEVIDKNEPLKFAENEGSLYIQTSAKTGDNVEKAFGELTRKLVKHYS